MSKMQSEIKPCEGKQKVDMRECINCIEFYTCYKQDCELLENKERERKIKT